MLVSRAWVRLVPLCSPLRICSVGSVRLRAQQHITRGSHAVTSRIIPKHLFYVQHTPGPSPTMVTPVRQDESSLTSRFYVNGTLRPEHSTDVFFVPPDNTNLINHICSQAYVLITGHCGSGKSTRCWYTSKSLPGYDVIWTSLQGLSATFTLSDFWRAYGKLIKNYCNSSTSTLKWAPDQFDIVDQETFLSFFAENRGRRIVLFIDEFDFLLSHPDASIQLLDALRMMKDQRLDIYGLQSVVAIDPYNITRYTKQQLSPFNVSDHWDIPYFSKVEVEQLFRDFKKARPDVVVAPEVIDRIYDITLGHPGMVCWCGKAIQDDKLKLSGTPVSLEKWIHYETFSLPDQIAGGWATVNKIASTVTEAKYSEYLINNVLSTNHQSLYDLSDPIQLELIRIGALSKREDYVEVSSPLIHAILLKNIVSPRKYLLAQIPVSDYLLDVPALMREIYQFDPVHMRNASKVTYKKNQTSRADVKEGGAVPHENSYQIEIISLIKALLPRRFRVSTEWNADDDRNTDIVITSPDGAGCVVLEAMAHARDGNAGDPKKGSVLEHIHRHMHYSKIDDARELWVVNFTTRKPDVSKAESGYGYVWSKYDKVRVIHVWHDLIWTTAKITEEIRCEEATCYTVTSIDLTLRDK